MPSSRFRTSVMLGCVIVLGARDGHASTYGGVSYYGNYVKVFEVISVGNRRDGGGEMAEVKRREEEAKPEVDALGKELDKYIGTLFSTNPQHPWIPKYLSKYPRKEDAKGRQIRFELSKFGMDSRYVAFQCKDEYPWLPMDVLMKAVVKQWLWESRKINQGSANPEHLDWIFEEFKKDRPVMQEDNLLALQLPPKYVEELKRSALVDDKEARVVSVKVLGLGGYISDPDYFEAFLGDEDTEIRKQAMLALFMIPNRQGEKVLKEHLQDIIGLFDEDDQESLRQYLGFR